MTAIYVDADACPVREEIYRVATRLQVQVLVVSNGSRPIRAPGLPSVEMVLVPPEPDAADDWIAERIGPADVCTTADIPLASRCLARDARALAFNGREWTSSNIGSALAGRALGQHLREIGVATGGPSALTARDRAAFLDALDRVVHAAKRGAATDQLAGGRSRVTGDAWIADRFTATMPPALWFQGDVSWQTQSSFAAIDKGIRPRSPRNTRHRCCGVHAARWCR